MRRHSHLIHFSREHHLALRLARHASAVGDMASLDEVRRQILAVRDDLLRHFRAEEEELLAELAARGESLLRERLLCEHLALSALLEAPDDVDSLHRLGELLRAHVHFEERELFPALEAGWGAPWAGR